MQPNPARECDQALFPSVPLGGISAKGAAFALQGESAARGGAEAIDPLLGQPASADPSSAKADAFLPALDRRSADLLSVLDAAFRELSAKPADPAVWRQVAVQMAGVQPQLAAVDPDAAEAMAQLLARTAANSGEAPVPADAAAKMMQLLQQIKASIPAAQEGANDEEIVTLQGTSLATGFSSRLFQSVGPEILRQLQQDRPAVSPAFLQQLDIIASRTALPPPAVMAGPGAGAQSAALLQWLRAAADAGLPSPAIVARAPVFGPASIVASLDELTTTAAVLPAPEKIFVTPEALACASDKAGLLPQLFARAGLSLEQTIASGAAVDATSLKALLLQLAQGEEASPPPSENGGAVTAPSSDSAAISGQAAAAAPLSAKITDAEKELLTIIDRLPASSIRQELIEAVEGRFADLVKGPVSDSPRHRRQAISSVKPCRPRRTMSHLSMGGSSLRRMTSKLSLRERSSSGWRSRVTIRRLFLTPLPGNRPRRCRSPCCGPLTRFDSGSRTPSLRPPAKRNQPLTLRRALAPGMARLSKAPWPQMRRREYAVPAAGRCRASQDRIAATAGPADGHGAGGGAGARPADQDRPGVDRCAGAICPSPHRRETTIRYAAIYGLPECGPDTPGRGRCPDGLCPAEKIFALS